MMKIFQVYILLLLTSCSFLFPKKIEWEKNPETFVNNIGMEFEMIQPGTVTVGKIEIECPKFPDTRNVPETEKWTADDFKRCQELANRDSKPGFLVKIEKAYFIGKYEVTQGQWKKVMGTNPSHFQGDKVTGDSDLHPVENVTREDAKAFTQKLNEMDPSSTYRLPTEFEWEYAARAGSDSLLSWSETGKQAWIQKSDKGTTNAVGNMKPNDWGLYDMLGNVWEWVEDFYNEDVFADPVPPKSGEVHVLKGGSFISDVTNATPFFHGGGPGNGYDVGFRIVREVR